ncbi:unnamed protein product, partial [Prorocentrum cordatum]
VPRAPGPSRVRLLPEASATAPPTPRKCGAMRASARRRAGRSLQGESSGASGAAKPWRGDEATRGGVGGGGGEKEGGGGVGAGAGQEKRAGGARLRKAAAVQPRCASTRLRRGRGHARRRRRRRRRKKRRRRRRRRRARLEASQRHISAAVRSWPGTPTGWGGGNSQTHRAVASQARDTSAPA